jgi:hypothetical protein
MVDWLGRVGATISLGVVCESCLGFVGLFALVTGASLGPTMTLGADCSLALLPGGCHFVPSRTRSDWTGSGVGRGWSCSLYDMASMDYMVPARSHTLLLSGHFQPLSRGPFRATYVSTETCKLQSSVREHTFATSGPCATVIIK